jgi:hypothetical protein
MRNKCVMKRVSNAVMTRDECHADVVRMLRECCTDVVRITNARHSSSKCDAKRAGCALTRVAPDVRSALHIVGYF